MTEALHIKETEFQKNQEDDPEALVERFHKVNDTVATIEEMNKNFIEGRSSFYDVIGNLRSVVSSDLRAYLEDGDPEDLAEVQSGLRSLEAYLQALSIREILDGEFTEAGADPQLRQEADREGAELQKSAIQIYAHNLAQKVEQMHQIE